MYENDKLCSACGGKCCKRQPGAAFPCDFGQPFDLSKLDKALKSGLWAVDWWEGPLPGYDDGDHPQAFFVRPAIKGAENKLFHASWGGECVFLTDKGCILSPEERPLNCKLTEPKEDGCILHKIEGKDDAAKAWLPYNDYFQLLTEMI